ncbi:MAG: tRNA pseudouridine(38-40) synthase TruA [Solirubrobacterales bacterium]
MAATRLEIAYDGSGFSGWAAQPGLRTVQAELESALERITGERIGLTVAGRTDAGVHALAQVASFDHDGALPDRLAERLNALLPHDVAVRAVEPAPDGFDARRDARSRTYRYRVLAAPERDPFEEHRALWWRHPLDLDRLAACADAVVGTHDFTAFTPTETEHVRFEREVFQCSWSRERRPSPDPPAPGGEAEDAGGTSVFRKAGATLVFTIEADAFMRNMVRVLVGTMLEVGGGRRSLEGFRSLLDGAPRERAGETAPAHGLYLISVRF